jgi:hypothetical protein
MNGGKTVRFGRQENPLSLYSYYAIFHSPLSPPHRSQERRELRLGTDVAPVGVDAATPRPMPLFEAGP